MKKIIIDEQGNKLKITSNMQPIALRCLYDMQPIALRCLYDFNESQQADIRDTFDYVEDIEGLLFLDEYNSVNDVLLLNGCWTSTDKVLTEALESIFHEWNVGYIPCSHTREYVALDNSCDCYLKINVTVIATPEGE